MSIEYRTRLQMEQVVQRHNQDSGSTRSLKIRDNLNHAYEMFARRARWPSLIEAKETGFSSTASKRFLYLPKDVWELYVVLPEVLGGIAPALVVETFFRGMLERDTIGPMVAYSDAGEVWRKVEFSTTPEKVVVDPSSASGENYSVFVEGIVGTDDRVSETLTITNSVSSTSANTYTDLISVSSNGSHTSYFSVVGATSVTTYATVSPEERTSRYKRLRLNYVPDTAETLGIYYKRRIMSLNNDNQVPEIPVCSAMEQYAIAMQYSEQRKWAEAFAAHMAMAEKEFAESIQAVSTEKSQITIAAPRPRFGSGGRDVIVVRQ